ncbi:hypothetical protein [Arenicella xantha]|uniref:Uncharacterized protein n=1 Tax=Arenicella xantha TaxID=644221 RepID=A0A395JME9_9GAMM|nr:hypothetical protein [Arenicella xantha]RBP51595.1 hypothetical protein DFR28_1021025 [Arenicella xantha]
MQIQGIQAASTLDSYRRLTASLVLAFSVLFAIPTTGESASSTQYSDDPALELYSDIQKFRMSYPHQILTLNVDGRTITLPAVIEAHVECNSEAPPISLLGLSTVMQEAAFIIQNAFHYAHSVVHLQLSVVAQHVSNSIELAIPKWSSQLVRLVR